MKAAEEREVAVMVEVVAVRVTVAAAMAEEMVAVTKVAAAAGLEEGEETAQAMPDWVLAPAARGTVAAVTARVAEAPEAVDWKADQTVEGAGAAMVVTREAAEMVAGVTVEGAMVVAIAGPEVVVAKARAVREEMRAMG